MPRAARAVIVCAVGLSALAAMPVAGAFIFVSARAAGDGAGGGTASHSVQISPDGRLASQASGTKNEAATPLRHASRTPRTQPGLPLRKPPRPVAARKQADAAKAKKTPPSRSVRDKKLCKALQSCRNGFIRCKGRIKHPDQSEAWIVAKEVCGAQYKTCVEIDFKSGEWLFTRWFYFQELNCQ